MQNWQRILVIVQKSWFTSMNNSGKRTGNRAVFNGVSGNKKCNRCILLLILLHEKFLQFDWLRAVVFHLNLKYLHVKITYLLQVVV